METKEEVSSREKTFLFCFPRSVQFSLDSPEIESLVTAGEDKNNPNRCRYKTHFTYLGATSTKYHGPILQYISMHHYSSPDPISDITYHTHTHHIQLHNPNTWAISITPALGQYHYHTH